jgi:uncharacterized protein CbrC (UPF0167 family)
MSQGSSVSVVIRLLAGHPGFNSWQGQEFFSHCHHVKTALGPTQPPIIWIMGLEWLGHESDYPHSSSTEVYIA